MEEETVIAGGGLGGEEVGRGAQPKAKPSTIKLVHRMAREASRASGSFRGMFDEDADRLTVEVVKKTSEQLPALLGSDTWGLQGTGFGNGTGDLRTIYLAFVGLPGGLKFLQGGKRRLVPNVDESWARASELRRDLLNTLLDQNPRAAFPRFLELSGILLA